MQKKFAALCLALCLLSTCVLPAMAQTDPVAVPEQITADEPAPAAVDGEDTGSETAEPAGQTEAQAEPAEDTPAETAEPAGDEAAQEPAGEEPAEPMQEPAATEQDPVQTDAPADAAETASLPQTFDANAAGLGEMEIIIDPAQPEEWMPFTVTIKVNYDKEKYSSLQEAVLAEAGVSSVDDLFVSTGFMVRFEDSYTTNMRITSVSKRIFPYEDTLVEEAFEGIDPWAVYMYNSDRVDAGIQVANYIFDSNVSVPGTSGGPILQGNMQFQTTPGNENRHYYDDYSWNGKFGEEGVSDDRGFFIYDVDARGEASIWKAWSYKPWDGTARSSVRIPEKVQEYSGVNEISRPKYSGNAFHTVTGIMYEAFSRMPAETTTVILPDTITYIDPQAFVNGPITSVIYEGTQSQWTALTANMGDGLNGISVTCLEPEAAAEATPPAAAAPSQEVVKKVEQDMAAVLANTAATDTEIRQALSQSEDLQKAMQTSDTVHEQVRELEEKFKQGKPQNKVIPTVTEEVKDRVDASKVTVVGAAFNVDNAGQDMTLDIKKTQRTYTADGTVASLDISLSNVVTAEDGTLAVPVCITMPVPAGVTDVSRLTIYHYHDGKVEAIRPQAVAEGIRFSVNSFSDFVFVQNASASQQPQKDPSGGTPTSTIPQTGDTMPLAALWLALAASALGLGAVLLRKKQK